jgi:hypothetical protein
MAAFRDALRCQCGLSRGWKFGSGRRGSRMWSIRHEKVFPQLVCVMKQERPGTIESRFFGWVMA